MIEILIMVFGVLPWFYRTAKRAGRNPVGWLLIGALSYYIPVIVMGRAVLPAALAGQVTSDNVIILAILSVALSVGAGIGGCLLARRAILSAGDPALGLADPGRSNQLPSGQTTCDGCRKSFPSHQYLEVVKDRTGYFCPECRQGLGRAAGST